MSQDSTLLPLCLRHPYRHLEAHMKKIIAISALALAVTACGGTAASAPAASPTATTTATAASTPAAVTTPATAATPTSAAAVGSETPGGTAATPAGASTPANSLVGTWTVDYGDPTVMSISQSGSVYTITVVGETEPVGVSCALPPGTKIATFSATGTGTYSGQQGTWTRNGSNVNCSFSAWVPTTLKLSATAPYSLVMPSTDPNDPLPVTFYKA